MMWCKWIAAAAIAALSSAAFGQGAQFPAGTVWGNDTAAQRPGKTSTVTAILDRAIGSTRGAILQRGASGWAVFGPGATARVPYLSGGTGADPILGAFTLPASVNSGGVACFNSTSSEISSNTLSVSQLILGGGVGGCPVAIGSLGTVTTVLHGNAASSPSYGPVVSADLNLTTTGCTNQFVTAISTGGIGTCSTDVLASAQHANQGTSTQVLHGNAAGNPAWGGVNMASDITGVTPFVNGGTNDTGTGASTYTPTATCSGGGSLTTSTITGRFKQLAGKFYWMKIDAVLTTVGTCVGGIDYSLPTGVTGVVQGNQIIMGREFVNNGKSMQGRMVNSATTARVAYYDNSAALVNGDEQVIEGIVEIQ